MTPALHKYFINATKYPLALCSLINNHISYIQSFHCNIASLLLPSEIRNIRKDIKL